MTQVDTLFCLPTPAAGIPYNKVKLNCIINYKHHHILCLWGLSSNSQPTPQLSTFKIGKKQQWNLPKTVYQLWLQLNRVIPSLAGWNLQNSCTVVPEIRISSECTTCNNWYVDLKWASQYPCGLNDLMLAFCPFWPLVVSTSQWNSVNICVLTNGWVFFKLGQSESP